MYVVGAANVIRQLTIVATNKLSLDKHYGQDLGAAANFSFLCIKLIAGPRNTMQLKVVNLLMTLYSAQCFLTQNYWK